MSLFIHYIYSEVNRDFCLFAEPAVLLISKWGNLTEQLLTWKYRPFDMNPNELEQTPPESEGKQLCKSCAALNEPDADFCMKCGAPLSAYSTMGPFEMIFAQGFIYREAAERPRRFIVVLGIWLIFLPQAIGGVVMIGSDPGLFWEIMGGAIIFISLAIIGRTTSNYLAERQRANKG
jgi:ribosomal protein L40E